ncbi:DNA polymerase III, subunit gamma and tau [Candidatus Jorgensenbacteria bacterium RIFCSPLOWO2_12_FULL_42_11]|uniref:DNA polymerase III subunit gamma/tau n=1 Tax=Candidatus Jorgensenbacteria bacterium RIFCSPLOWO2_12_FULL_42_11 TaxID=1798473 RepID=A0A1F6C0T0_9BACT|nr:MAG: DNA polymerase III, subunit gamma and tau [Candidatus Jorgensenbacteria bacterium RIFCSPLOWO2_12_FULL_42_11]
MALAIYRKYRPRIFEDLLGQELISQILKNAAGQNKFSHAYLFSGPRGSGKTTAARLISKTANCLTRQTDAKFAKLGEPCDHCSACAEIDRGQALDVVEIDAASNRGIDEIRNLKESVRLSPTSFQKKIFIIDEAHMLTKEAFNALLKTLEEPPEHVIMILATTEFEKIPATIVSRTQQFHFKKIPLMKIAAKLKKIAANEKMEISMEALELIAASAEGSFRDAESLLDQLLSFNYQKIGIDEVEGMIGKVTFSKTAAFAEILLTGQTDKVLGKLAEIEDDGYNLVQFNKDLIHYLRKALVLKFEPSLEKSFRDELTPESLLKLKSHAQLIKDSHLGLLKALINAYSQMRYSQFPIIPLEVAIVENLKTEGLKH